MNSLIIVLAIFVIFLSCKETVTFPCQDIREGLLMTDLELTKPGIDLMLQDMLPVSTGEDALGHEINLQEFVDRLNTNCDIEAVIECYACIKTFPLLSHVTVTIVSDSVQQRSLDILTPEGGAMSLKNIHQ